MIKSKNTLLVISIIVDLVGIIEIVNSRIFKYDLGGVLNKE